MSIGERLQYIFSPNNCSQPTEQPRKSRFPLSEFEDRHENRIYVPIRMTFGSPPAAQIFSRRHKTT